MYRLGVLAPLTGPASLDAKQMVLGARLGVDEILDLGEDEWKLLVADTGDMSRSRVEETVLRLIGSDVDAVVTGYASRDSFEIELLGDAEVPYVVAEHSMEMQRRVLEKPERYATVWGLMPSYDRYGSAVAPYIEQLISRDRLPLRSRRVSILASDVPYSRWAADGIRSGFETAGWTIEADVTVPFGRRLEWSSFVRALRAAPCDLLVSTDYLPHNAAALVRAVRAASIECAIFIQYAPKYPQFFEAAGDEADGILFNVLGGPIDGLPATLRVRELFASRYALSADRYAIDAYQGVHVIAAARHLTGLGATRRDTGLAIGRVELDVAEGHLRFDPRTHLAADGDDAFPMQWFQAWGGRGRRLAPPQLATDEFRPPPPLRPHH